MQITDFRFETKSIGEVRNAFSYHIKRSLYIYIVLCTGGVKFETCSARAKPISATKASHADNSDMV